MSIPNNISDRPDRRQFLQHAAVLGTTAAFAAQALADTPREDNPPVHGAVPRRKFGKSDVEVSILGVGGHAIGLAKLEEEAIRIVQEAVDHGVTFMDNAWEYHDGRSEDWMGKALKGRRDKTFLMTKVCTHGRDAKVGLQQLEESLRRLQTDHLDLWQIHECVYYNDPQRHFAKGGVIEAIDKAKQQGKTRFVGFTGHKDPAIHIDMLSHDYAFDAVQMPINVFDSMFRSFQKNVLPELNRRGIAAIGMKSLGGNGEMIKQKVLTIEEALRYALSQPIATLVSGMDSISVLRQNLKIVQNFKPMSGPEMEGLRQRCRESAMDGRFELFKTSAKFEGPPGREQHGFPAAPKMQD